MMLPKAPPRGAPAAKVANAIDRAREGGNEWAKVPNWDDVDMRITLVQKKKGNATHSSRNGGGGAHSLATPEDIHCDAI